LVIPTAKSPRLNKGEKPKEIDDIAA
jgi:hypothetical protein